MTTHIGMLLYPNMTQLDLTGPYELFIRMPDAKIHLLWKDTNPVRADGGITFVPDTAFADCPPLDVVFVPGGKGQIPLMSDEVVLAFLRKHAETAQWITSVCTGSLVLGAAGLLNGYKATTHWAFRELIPSFGATLAPGRVVVDRNRITAGGVTAGIDFGLTVFAKLAGDEAAKMTQLGLEYDPAPPFDCGHPDRADPALVEKVRKRLTPR